ncbi:MAG: hypothetical protein ACXWC6_12355 [Ramlibacter sp.]
MTKDEFERRMQEWRDADQAARQAKEELQSLGQAANDPRLAAMYRDAAALQGAADALLSALIANLKPRP